MPAKKPYQVTSGAPKKRQRRVYVWQAVPISLRVSGLASGVTRSAHELWRLGFPARDSPKISHIEGSQGAAKRWPSCPWQHLRGKVSWEVNNKGRDRNLDSKGCSNHAKSKVGMLAASCQAVFRICQSIGSLLLHKACSRREHLTG